jgi:hypothetical protein
MFKKNLTNYEAGKMRKLLIFYEAHPSWEVGEEPPPPVSPSFMEEIARATEMEPQEKARWMEVASLPREEQEKLMRFLEWEEREPEIKKTWDRVKRKVEEVMSELDPKRVKLYRDSCFYLGDWPEAADVDLEELFEEEYSEMKRQAEEGKLLLVFQHLLKVLPPENFVGPEDPMIWYLDELLSEGILKLKEKVTGEKSEETLRNEILKLKAKVTDKNSELKLIYEILTRFHEVMIIARDIAMANTINRTLREGETGLLFIGLVHEPQRFLAPDIQYEVVFGREEWPGGLQKCFNELRVYPSGT